MVAGESLRRVREAKEAVHRDGNFGEARMAVFWQHLGIAFLITGTAV